VPSSHNPKDCPHVEGGELTIYFVRNANRNILYCYLCDATFVRQDGWPEGQIKGESMISKEELENWFMYHQPKAEDVDAYMKIREAGKNLANVIVENTPASADQSAAIRLVREAIMTANAARACRGK